MNVTTKIKMDLRRPDITLRVDAVQGDSCSRSLEIALYSGVTAWTVPVGITVAVRYCKPDGTKGYYDTLPDGDTAWSIHNNLLTVKLAPQMLTVAGTVLAQVEMIQGINTLSTFSLKVCVEKNLAAGFVKSENYINWLQWLKDQSDEQTQIVESSVEKAVQAAQDAIKSANRADTSANTATDAASSAVSASVSADTAKKAAEDIAAGVSAVVAGNQAYTKRESDLRYSPSIVQTLAGETIFVSDSAEAPFYGLNLYGKTTQTGTPSPENPIPPVNAGSTGTVEVQVTGKNLCPQAAYSAGLIASKGFIRKNTPVTSPYTAVAWGGVGIWIPVLENEIYTVSTDITPNRYFTITYYKDSNISSNTAANAISFKEYANTNKVTFTTPAGCLAVVITAVNNTSSEFTWSFWQVERGSSATGYEPYTSQTITLQTPNGLPGIPVESDGNYTDNTGQQWICDEVDFSKGVSIQRIGRIDSYNGESVGSVYLSSTGGLDVGAEVLYPLPEPEETSLATDILMAYGSLHLLYPQSTVSTDADIGISISYVADPKLYIHNLLASLG